jgi:hypothetical protein
LEPFAADARLRILQYATQHLGISAGEATRLNPSSPENAESLNAGIQSPASPRSKVVDIRTFKDEKQPKTDIQMAAIVAYYLAELVPAEDRKDAITPDDISKYFKQAGHPLPRKPRFTLVNARTAGYFESAGGGAYKLNPVGHNLIAHGLPKSGDYDVSRPRKKANKSATKKAKKPAKK